MNKTISIQKADKHGLNVALLLSSFFLAKVNKGSSIAIISA
jgi:hypothetical protein